MTLKALKKSYKALSGIDSINKRFNILLRIGKILMPQYRFKWPQMKWWHNQPFNDYLVRFDEIDGMNTDRRWMLYQLMRLIKSVPGDTAECGVYKGSSSYLICRINQNMDKSDRMHHIFDSFEGMSSPSHMDGSHWKVGDLSYEMAKVEKNLSEFGNFKIYKGWIPDRFPELSSKKFAFVHIDVDLYGPTRDSIEFFYPRLNSNGIILCDDYGFTSCPGATKAIDEYLSDKPEKMISLSCGAGFFIKAWPTSPELF